jgi:hypothetical protein
MAARKQPRTSYKFTEDARLLVLEGVRYGLSEHDQAGMARVRRETLREWKAKGRADLEAGNDDTDFARFVLDYDEAFSTRSNELVKLVASKNPSQLLGMRRGYRERQASAVTVHNTQNILNAHSPAEIEAELARRGWRKVTDGQDRTTRALTAGESEPCASVESD